MKRNEKAKISRKVEGINLIINLAWTFIFLFPLVIFCLDKMSRDWFIISISISVMVVFLPSSFFNAIRLSKSRLFYRKAGIEFFNQFIQNGTMLNRFVKNKYPEYKRFFTREEAFNKLFNQSYMFEKFHFILFVFFVETMLFAINNRFYGWAVFLIVANILYNIYPILLQQYIRLRLEGFRNGMQGSKPTNL